MLENKILNDVIQSLGVGVSVYDLEKNFLLSNQKYADLFDFKDSAGKTGNGIDDVIFDDDDACDFLLQTGVNAEQWSSQFIDQVSDYSQDYQIKRSDGRYFVGAIQKTGLDGYLITIRDNTEQRRAQQAERESDLLLHKIVESCPATFNGQVDQTWTQGL